MKSTILVALMALATPGLRGQTAESILELHCKAIGGIEKWNKVTTIKMSGVCTYPGSEFTVTKTISTGRAMRIDNNFNGTKTFQVLTIHNGWVGFPYQGSDKVDTIREENAKLYWPEIDMKDNQLLTYTSTGMKWEYAGTDTIESKPCYVIKYRDPHGHRYTSFFDTHTYYLLRTETTITTEDQDKEYFVSYGNYKEQNGIMLPTSIATPNGKTNYDKIEINVPVDESFLKPLPPGTK